MRPVIRGDASHYDPNTPPVRNALNHFGWAQTRVRALRSKITEIDGKMSTTYKFGRRAGKSVAALHNSTLRELRALEPALTDAYKAAIEANDDGEINHTGAALIFNLELQLVLQADFVNPVHATRLNSTYASARADLITNIGQYCSYCEMPLAASLAVEHMLPKAEFPRLAVAWTNFLLACPICNSRKSNNPSLFLATMRAQNATGHALPSDSEIIAGGYSLMLWPSDPAVRYANFSQAYQFVMRKVQYMGQYALNTEIIPGHVLAQKVQNAELFWDSDTGDQIVARFYDQQPLSLTTPALTIAYLQAITAPTPIDASNAGNVPADLRGQLNNLGVDFTDAAAKFEIRPGIPHPEDGQEPEAWTLREKRAYTIGTLSSQADITDAAGRTVRRTVNSRELVGPLKLGLFPPTLARYWGYEPFQWTFTSETEEDSRVNFEVKIKREFIFELALGSVVNLYRFSTAPIEVQIQAVQQADFDMQKSALNSIFFAGLNERQNGDPKDSDRRVIKRTRAWFSAVQSVRNLVAAWQLDQTTYPNIRADMLETIKHTMTATGFWTIWYSVINQYWGTMSPVIRPLNKILKDVTNFPGTR